MTTDIFTCDYYRVDGDSYPDPTWVKTDAPPSGWAAIPGGPDDLSNTLHHRRTHFIVTGSPQDNPRWRSQAEDAIFEMMKFALPYQRRRRTFPWRIPLFTDGRKNFRICFTNMDLDYNWTCGAKTRSKLHRLFKKIPRTEPFHLSLAAALSSVLRDFTDDASAGPIRPLNIIIVTDGSGSTGRNVLEGWDGLPVQEPSFALYSAFFKLPGLLDRSVVTPNILLYERVRIHFVWIRGNGEVNGEGQKFRNENRKPSGKTAWAYWDTFVSSLDRTVLDRVELDHTHYASDNETIAKILGGNAW